jgi:hypothetical protein
VLRIVNKRLAHRDLRAATASESSDQWLWLMKQAPTRSKSGIARCAWWTVSGTAASPRRIKEAVAGIRRIGLTGGDGIELNDQRDVAAVVANTRRPFQRPDVCAKCAVLIFNSTNKGVRPPPIQNGGELEWFTTKPWHRRPSLPLIWAM